MCCPNVDRYSIRSWVWSGFLLCHSVFQVYTRARLNSSVASFTPIVPAKHLLFFFTSIPLKNQPVPGHTNVLSLLKTATLSRLVPDHSLLLMGIDWFSKMFLFPHYLILNKKYSSHISSNSHSSSSTYVPSHKNHLIIATMGN